MAIYSEETVEINFGSGLFSADLPSAIPDGFCSEALNVVPTGTSVESRYGFRKSSVSFFQSSINPPDDNEIYLSRMEANQNLGLPAMVWGAKNGANDCMYMVRDGSIKTNPVTPTITDGYAIINLGALGRFRGAMNYNNRMYFNTTTGVYKINSITWSASPSISSTSVTGPVGCTTGLFHFQDRIWTSKDNVIHYTDPPATPGAFPETWNIGTNFIVLVGTRGPAIIYKMIPLGTRIYVFTNQGLFVLSINGGPSDWYLRIADDKVKVNNLNCAFELSGVIYFVCDLGVFATTGNSTVKLSGSIENLFLQGNQTDPSEIGQRRFTDYRIDYLDGGMLVSISPRVLKTNDNGGSNVTAFYVGEDCQILYSRVDSVAWSKWEFPPNNPDSDSDPNYNYRINAVLGVCDNIATYVNSAPLSYVWLAHSRSISSDAWPSLSYPAQQLFNYDGFSDIYTAAQWLGNNPSGTGSTMTPAEVSAPLYGSIRSHYFNGGNPIAVKQFNKAFLDLFLPTPEAYSNLNQSDVSTKFWRYRWFTDQRVYVPSDTILYNQPVPDTFANEFSIVALSSNFKFRTCQIELRFRLVDNTIFKVKKLYLKEFTQRDAINVQQ